MPFKSNSKMDQQRSFIRDYLTEEYYFKSLCEAYGISRQSGYSLVRRYEKEGDSCFLPRSRRPNSNPNKTPTYLVEKIVLLRTRKKKNRWGAKKIRVKLVEDYGESVTPSLTTIQNILVRKGLVTSKKRKRKVIAQDPIFDPTACNEVWSVDHKGKFYLGNGKRCSPLTVCDSYSRYLFKAKGQYKETWKGVQKELRQLFREWGQPEYLHSDNGSAFASPQSPRGFGSLSYWLLDHGIIPVFSDPGCPSQNGRQERMHKDLKAECCTPPFYDLRSQNRGMNAFGGEYNDYRPHEGLDMRLPADVHTRSLIEYQDKVAPAVYDETMSVRVVCQNGAVRWRSYEWLSICNALAGKYVGIKELPNRVHEVYYRKECLGFFQDGEQIFDGKYHLLNSDRDLPERFRDVKKRKRK